MCGHPLTDPESIKLGVGPDCAEKRQQFLGVCGTSTDEIGQLTLLDNPTVSRWLSKFSAAMRLTFQDGRRRHTHERNAQYFLDQARAAASMPPIREMDHLPLVVIAAQAA